MLGDPRSGSKVWEALDREIRKPRENRRQIVADGEFQPATASPIERIAATFGPAWGLPMCLQFFRPSAIPQTFCPCRSRIRDSLSLASALWAEDSLSR